MVRLNNSLFYILVLTCVLIISGCLNDKSKNDVNTGTDQSELQKVTLREAWFPWAGYAGELEATRIDSMYGIDLKIEPGADDIDPIKLVISGQNDCGVASAESVLLANQKGANLVIVGVISYKSPTCFVALADKNINSVSDFENKRVGILTGTETETVYRILMKKMGYTS